MKKIFTVFSLICLVGSLFAVSPKQRYKEEKEELEQKQIDYIIDWAYGHQDGYCYIYDEKDVEQKYDYGFSIVDKYNLVSKFQKEGYNFEEYSLENEDDMNTICEYYYTLAIILFEYMQKDESCLLFEATEDEIIVAGYNNSKNEYFISCIY